MTMGKSKNKKRKLEKASANDAKTVNSAVIRDDGEQAVPASMFATTSATLSTTVANDGKISAYQSPSQPNPLFEQQDAFLQSLSETERTSFFCDEVVQPDRRAEIWMHQADLGERLLNDYAWATPNERSLRILAHYSPLIEIGCGSNAYWCRQLKAAHPSVDVVGYDVAPSSGGKTYINSKNGVKGKKGKKSDKDGDFTVQTGGPGVLADVKHQHRTLFLCYPDENDVNDKEGDDDETPETNNFSLANACLDHYTGDIVIHVGELMATTLSSPTLSLGDQAPYGRSSAPDFQERLCTQFHCLLCVPLPNWLHTADCLTVWKRSSTTTIVFEADDNEGDDDNEPEEVEYRHIPVNERLPVAVAAPCLQFLLDAPTTTTQAQPLGGQVKSKAKIVSDASPPPPQPKRHKKAKVKAEATETADSSTYECPW